MRRSVIRVHQPPSIFALNQKIIQKNRMEKIIWLSSVLLIGYIYVWIFAIYWIRVYKSKSLRMFRMWQQNPSYQGFYPFLPEFHPSLTQHPAYYIKLKRAESIKSALMYTLAIPFVGYALVLVISVATLGIIPLIIYYIISDPTRYVKNVQRQMQYQARTTATTYQTPQPVSPPTVQYTPRKPVDLTGQNKVTTQASTVKANNDIIYESPPEPTCFWEFSLSTQTRQAGPVAGRGQRRDRRRAASTSRGHGPRSIRPS